MIRPFLLLLAACTAGPDKGNGGAEACEPPPETELPEACACEDAGIEVGSGDTSFQAVEEGSALTMVHGPQGGWHMLGSARFSNLLPIVSIHYTIEVVETGLVISDNTYRVQMVEDGECTGFYPGMYGYLDVSELAVGDRDTPPEVLGGQAVRLRMEVTDTEQRTASDTLQVVAALDPVDEPDTGGADTGE